MLNSKGSGSWLRSRFRPILILAVLVILIPGCQDQKKEGKGNTGAPTAAAGCKCVEIKLLYPSTELGPDGKKNAQGPADNSAQAWPTADGTSYHDELDGKTVGPMAKNPGNPKAINGQKNIGYAFEIKCTVEGTPGACKEIQLVKATTTKAHSVMPKRWIGKTTDLDLDGTPDIDVSTKDKCAAAKGKWDATKEKCSLEFPQNGPKYGPDVQEDTGDGGAYEREFDYKKHVNQTIIWFDAPMFSRDTATSKDGDFIAIVRGTDSKYCYIKFTIRLKRRMKKAETDVEELMVTDSGNHVDRVPGIP